MNTICFGSFHSSICSDKVGLLKSFEKRTGKHMCQSFFLDKVAHHQACNFIKSRFWRRCFTVNFAKLLKALCWTPPVSASNFNLNFLTLRLRKRYIYVFPGLLFFGYFFWIMFLIEARNKCIWFYNKCWVKQAISDVLTY